MQHYHTSTNLSRKLNASLRYLHLQLSMPHNPLLLDYDTWGHLAPLLWVMMLWQMLHHFDIHLHMTYLTIAFPWERDQVIMEIFHSGDLGPDLLWSLRQCRVAHEGNCQLQQLAALLKIPALIFYRGLAHVVNCWSQPLAAPLKTPALFFYRGIAHAFEYFAYQ